jgi:hypothetical protein
VARHDLEGVVELDVDLGAVVEGDLHLVGALLVAGLGLGHLAAAGLLEGGDAGLLEVLAGQRPVVGVVADEGVVALGGGHAGAPGHERQSGSASGDPAGPAVHRVLLWGCRAPCGHIPTVPRRR